MYENLLFVLLVANMSIYCLHYFKIFIPNIGYKISNIITISLFIISVISYFINSRFSLILFFITMNSHYIRYLMKMYAVSDGYYGMLLMGYSLSFLYINNMDTYTSQQITIFSFLGWIISGFLCLGNNGVDT